MPTGNTNGSKLITRGGLVSSLSILSRVRDSHVHLFPPFGPRDGGVVGRIAGPADSDDQMPSQRMLVDARDQRVIKRSFLFPSVAPVALTGANGCTGAIVQRTGVEAPAKT